MKSISNKVTVILNLWKRNHLEEQLDALANQTTRPFEVWVIQYENHFSVTEILVKYESILFIDYFSISVNLKYYGRFTLANLVKSDYVWILDDDVIPGKRWIEYCITKTNEYNSIVACSGRKIPKGDYEPEGHFEQENFIGDCSDSPFNFSATDVMVDFGIQSYFFKRKWLAAFWGHYPVTFEIGEDIHLAGTLNIELGVGCIVPAQTTEEFSGNLRPAYGFDEHATWRKSKFIEQRRICLDYLINQLGWRPMMWGEKPEQGPLSQ